MRIVCLNCGRPYPEDGAPYTCPRCGGLFDDADPITWHGADPSRSGIWRYAPTLGEPESPVSLGEGSTPLVAGKVLSRTIQFKCEHLNPTGSFKDRGTAALVTFLNSRGVKKAIEDSSGNAGASFAAYAARAGVKAAVYLPDAAAGPKRRQIEMYGAEVVVVPGPRSEASVAVRAAADGGAVYASHAYLPHNIPAYATCAYEIWDQLGVAPGAVVAPAGQGGLLLGLCRGFRALLEAQRIRKLPVMVGVQAEVCAPLAALFEIGANGLSFITEAETLAEGVRVRTPVRADATVKAVRDTGGYFVTVPEDRILPGRDALAQMGFYVEPTSALVWYAIQSSLPDLPDPVVVVLTGSGYKSIR
jgi:threonine synthase